MQLTIFTDGGSRGNPGPAAIGGVIFEGTTLLYEFSEYIGVGTNNEAEYKAILHSLEWIADYVTNHTIDQITWKLDSTLVVEQLNRHWKIKEPRMQLLAQLCWDILDRLPCPFRLTYVPRKENTHADALVNQALDAHT